MNLAKTIKNNCTSEKNAVQTFNTTVKVNLYH